MAFSICVFVYQKVVVLPGFLGPKTLSAMVAKVLRIGNDRKKS